MALKYPIIEASPVALALCVQVGEPLPREVDDANAIYPFKSMQIKEAFAVPIDDLGANGLSKLRVLATQYGKRQGKKFKVILHNEYKCVEVARIG